MKCICLIAMKSCLFIFRALLSRMELEGKRVAANNENFESDLSDTSDEEG